MNKYKILLFVFIIISIFNFANNNVKIKEELNLIKNNLITNHPLCIEDSNFKNYISMDFDNLIENSKKLEIKEINFKIMEIIARFHDLHTRVNFTITDYQMPFNLILLKEGYYVVETTKEEKELLNSRLISINGFNIEKLKNAFSDIVIYENEYGLKSSMEYYIVLKDLLEYKKITNSDSTVCEFEKEGKIFSKKIYFTDYKSVIIKQKNVSLPYQNQDKYYWYKYLENEKILYIKINHFISKDNKIIREKYNEIIADNFEDLPSLNDMVKNMFDDLEKKDIKKVIIDIRDNPGGFKITSQYLINKLIMKDLYGKDNLYVITGNKTASAALEFTLYLKSLLNAKIIGNIPMQNINFFSIMKKEKLSELGLSLLYSTARVPYSSEKKPVIFFPDVIINENFEDYKSGKDSIIEYIQKLKIISN